MTTSPRAPGTRRAARPRESRPGAAVRHPEQAAPAAAYPPDEFDVEYETGQRRGAHRTATPAVLEQLPYLVVALVAVVAVVAAFGLLTGGDDPPAAAGSTTPTASEPATSDPTGTDPAPTTEPPASTEPPPTSAAPEPTADRSVPLVVLNGTSTSGLAADVGDELEELGWTIGTVGNADDKPVETTVVLYSAADHQVTAEALAADLDAVAELDEDAPGDVVVVIGTDRA